MRFFTLSAVAALALASSVTASTDIDTLNYALTLEWLESAFYNATIQAYPNAASFGSLSALYPNIVLISGHENAHVQFLNKTIVSLGGTPVGPCNSYNFTQYLTDPQTVINSAAFFEGVGVTAYDGAVNTIVNPALQQGAATIATIEARHADFLQQWATATYQSKNIPYGTDNTNDKGYPGAFDNATSYNDIVNTVGGLLKDGVCGTDLNALSARNTPSNYTTAYVAGTSATLQQNDLNALNYALFLENFEAAFYAHYVGSASQAGAITDFSAQDTAASLPSGTTLARLQLIGAHEAAHVSFLQTALSGHSPVAACSGSNAYTWSQMNATTFLSTAAAIEAAGVNAYDGAVNTITNPAYQQAAATIATIEARHADYLATISGGTEFKSASDGGAFDTASTPSQIADAVSKLGFIPAGCISTLSALPSTPTSTSATPKNAAGQTSVNFGSIIAAGLAAAAIMA